MYIYTYIFISKFICTYIHIYFYICIHISAMKRTGVLLTKNTHTPVCINICVYMYMYISAMKRTRRATDQ